MKYWIRLFVLLGCVVLFFALIGSFLPHGYSFSVSTEIQASATEVFDSIDNLPKWKTWSQWNPDEIQDLSVEYSSDGKSQKWTDVRGDGKLWFTGVDEPNRLDYEMRFSSFPEMKSSIILTPTGETTKVVWSSEGVLPSGPFYGYFRSVFESGMKRQYETSLQKLKRVVEEKLQALQK